MNFVDNKEAMACASVRSLLTAVMRLAYCDAAEGIDGSMTSVRVN